MRAADGYSVCIGASPRVPRRQEVASWFEALRRVGCTPIEPIADSSSCTRVTQVPGMDWAQAKTGLDSAIQDAEEQLTR